MVVAFYDWIPFYEAKDEVKFLLVQMSASTIDRLLRSHRSPLQRGLSATRPSLIKNRIPLKLLDGDITIPGYIEAMSQYVSTRVSCLELIKLQTYFKGTNPDPRLSAVAPLMAAT